MIANIDLSTAETYEVRGRTIWIDNGTHEVTLFLPRSARVSLHKRERSATINLGTVNKITLSISGPLGTMRALYKDLTDR